MGIGLFITGTDTDVGKTFAVAGITHVLKKSGMSVCSYKPIESGAMNCNGRFISKDSLFVKQICGLDEKIESMNTYSLEYEASPHIALEAQSKKISLANIKKDYTALSSRYDAVVVEGCGGIAVPLERDGLYVHDVITELGIPCIVVARSGLGTINHTLLTVDFARRRGVDVRGVILNGYEGGAVQDDNVKIIESAGKVPVVAKIEKCKFPFDKAAAADTFERGIDPDTLKKAIGLG